LTVIYAYVEITLSRVQLHSKFRFVFYVHKF